jgi:hypothetical protein
MRRLHFGAPFGLLRQQEIQRSLQHLLRRGAGLGVPLSLPRGLELLDELLRDGHVETAEVGGQRYEGRSAFRRREHR